MVAVLLSPLFLLLFMTRLLSVTDLISRVAGSASHALLISYEKMDGRNIDSSGGYYDPAASGNDPQQQQQQGHGYYYFNPHPPHAGQHQLQHQQFQTNHASNWNENNMSSATMEMSRVMMMDQSVSQHLQQQQQQQQQQAVAAAMTAEALRQMVQQQQLLQMQQQQQYQQHRVQIPHSTTSTTTAALPILHNYDSAAAVAADAAAVTMEEYTHHQLLPVSYFPPSSSSSSGLLLGGGGSIAAGNSAIMNDSSCVVMNGTSFYNGVGGGTSVSNGSSSLISEKKSKKCKQPLTIMHGCDDLMEQSFDNSAIAAAAAAAAAAGGGNESIPMDTASRDELTNVVATAATSTATSLMTMVDPSREISMDGSTQLSLVTTKEAMNETVIDKTSTNYLQSLLAKKRMTKKTLSSSPHPTSTTTTTTTTITIPSTFPIIHSYRATAAYSLLRTLSKELRLSPFTLQSFTSALLLPLPSKLLGEVHMRVLRVLFASAGVGQYYYDNLGDNDGIVDVIQRRKKQRIYNKNNSSKAIAKSSSNNDANSISEEEGFDIIKKRGGNNLSYLDQSTWPLFYQDYALSTERSILDVMSSANTTVGSGRGDRLGSSHKVDEEFIDVKSVAMIPLYNIELRPKSSSRMFQRVNYGAKWVNRCPAGPHGKRNQHGRYLCCPFHISTAVQFFRKKLPPSQQQPSSLLLAKGTNVVTKKKRGRSPKKGSKKTTKTSRKSTLKWMDNNSSDSSEESDDDDDFEVTEIASDDDDVHPPPFTKKIKPNDPVVQQNDSNTVLRHLRGGADIRHILEINRLCAEFFPQSREELLNTYKGREDQLLKYLRKMKNQIERSVVDLHPRHFSAHPAVLNPNFVDLTIPDDDEAVIITPAMQPQPLVGSFRTQSSTGQQIMQSMVPNPLAQCQGNSCRGTIAMSQSTTLPTTNIQSQAVARQLAVAMTQSISLPTNTSQHFQTKLLSQASVSLTPPPPPPILVHPVIHRPINKYSILVSNETAESVERFFSCKSTTKEADYSSDRHNSITYCPETLDQDRNETKSHDDDDHLLAHMIPVQQLERGIPYHHLSLDAKLAILEFILDELLQVTEISNEMTRRESLTSTLPELYGTPPLPNEYEELINADECMVCGYEGDLLCCDGCPASVHRGCIGLGNGRLPEGKWLCPECKIIDASTMGPLGYERRPMLGWFTIDDLESSTPHPQPDDIGTVTQFTQPGFSSTKQSDIATQVWIGQVWDQQNPSLCVTPIRRDDIIVSETIKKYSMSDSCKIPPDVEFLVTAGKVFARYRSTLEPFDPFNTTVIDLSNPPLFAPLKPPLPLNGRQLGELLKLLGPQVCLALPFLRITFRPQKVFADFETSTNEEYTTPHRKVMQDAIQKLISHQEETLLLLSNHSEWNNPMIYSNAYHKAPSLPIIKAQLGHFLLQSNEVVSISHYSVSSTMALSIPLLDLTDQLNKNLSIPAFDPIKLIRDKLIFLGRSLDSACLLDLKWIKNNYWKTRVENAKSIQTLCSLLINLIDACCLRAFLPVWYTPKESNINADGGADRVQPAYSGSEEFFVTLSDEWGPKEASIFRKWERCSGSGIRRLLHGLVVDGFNGIINPAGKRRNKTSKAEIKMSIQTAPSTSTNASINITAEPVQIVEQVSPAIVEQAMTERFTETENGAASDSFNIDRPSAILMDEPIRPKRPLTSYNIFYADAKNVFAEQLDKLTSKTKCNSFINSKWKAMNDGEKKRFKDQQVEAQQKYSELLQQYEKAMDKYSSLHPELELSTEMSPSDVIDTERSAKKKNLPCRDSLVASTSKRSSDRVNHLRKELESILNSETKDSKVQRAMNEIKIDAFEKLLSVDNTATAHGWWPLAGKMLFEPDGSLSRPIVKCLARNAASIRAPSVLYESLYEVGETTVCHRWRKKTAECSSYEGLLHCLKFLDAHIDKSVITNATSIATRAVNLNNNPTTVHCVHTDPLTGLKEYLVVPNSINRGTWYSEKSIELYPLIYYRLEQQRLYLGQNGLHKSKSVPDTIKHITSSSNKSEHNHQVHETKSKPSGVSAHDNEAKFQASIEKHRDETVKLLKSSAAKGEASVPVKKMASIRKKCFAAMASAKMIAGGKRLTEQELNGLLVKAEQDAVALYIQELHHLKAIRPQLN